MKKSKRRGHRGGYSGGLPSENDGGGKLDTIKDFFKAKVNKGDKVAKVDKLDKVDKGDVSTLQHLPNASPPPPISSATKSQAPVNPLPSTLNTGLNRTFLTLYQLLIFISIIIFIVLIVTGLVDIILYARNEAVQHKKKDNLLNKDTTDVKVFGYLKTTSLDDEPYNIYLEQRLVAILFIIGGVLVGTIGFQLGVVLALKAIALWNQRKGTMATNNSVDGVSADGESVYIPKKMLIAMVIVIIAAFGLSALYRRDFVKKVQSNIKDVRNQMWKIRNFIYANMSDNSTFLAALRADNMADIIDTIGTTLQSKDPSTCTDKMTPCDKDVEKMIFTLNLYSYMKMHIPDDNSGIFEQVMSIFTPEGLGQRSIDPSMYFEYNKPVYVTNLYPRMREQLGKYFVAATTNTEKTDKTKQTPKDNRREAIFIMNLNRKMRELNQLLAKIYNITGGKKRLRTYMLKYLWLVLFFGLLFTIVFIKEVRELFASLMVIIASIRNWWQQNKPATSPPTN